jgi:hypothetical protein
VAVAATKPTDLLQKSIWAVFAHDQGANRLLFFGRILSRGIATNGFWAALFLPTKVLD